MVAGCGRSASLLLLLINTYILPPTHFPWRKAKYLSTYLVAYSVIRRLNAVKQAE
jgi:hypothetical protein